MKKILITTFLILISLPTYSYGAWACLIQDETAEVLLDYIKVNDLIMKNVNSAILGYNEEDQDWYFSSKVEIMNNRKNETVSIFNQMFNFSWFFSYFDYYVTSPIFNELAIPVKRDYKFLKNENKKLENYIKAMDRWWKTHVIVENACEWVDIESCKENLNGKESKEIIWELLINNQRIIDLYQLTVVWKFDEFNEKRLIIVNNNFTLEIYKHYSKEAINICNQEEEWGFFESISESITQVKEYNKLWKDWIQEWRAAWQLLVWNNPIQEDIIEKRLLKEYLSEQWISTDNQAIVLNNLEKYNQDWISLNNNFLTNSFISNQAKIIHELKEWKQEVVWDFFTKKHENTEEDLVNYKEISQIADNSVTSKRIQEKIINLYEKEVPFTSIWDIDTSILRAKIIETHFSLDYSIRILEKAELLSQKICDKQDRWEWICK